MTYYEYAEWKAMTPEQRRVRESLSWFPPLTDETLEIVRNDDL
jgi:hypothetical protein